MSQAVANQSSANSLTGLLMPLTDRTPLLPNVAVAELIPYRAPQVSEGMPSWFLGQVAWRDLRLPLLSFEAAPDGQVSISPGSRVAVASPGIGGAPWRTGRLVAVGLASDAVAASTAQALLTHAPRMGTAVLLECFPGARPGGLDRRGVTERHPGPSRCVS